jgi:hypothetical protein
MLLPKKSRLAVAAAAAGTVCALAAAGAAAAAPTGWSGGASAVPNAFTNATPGLAAFYNASDVRGTFLVWKAQLANTVDYKYEVAGKWSATAAIPGATTSAGPAAGYYTDPFSKNAELVVWKALNTDAIDYSTGQVQSDGALSWTAPHSIAVTGDSLATTDEGPAVIFPLNSPGARVIIAWRGPGTHVRYELGSPSGRLFAFDKSQWISGGSKLDETTTSGTPALANVLGNGGKTGTVYVFWKAAGTGKVISYASTPDNAGGLGGGKTIPWTLLGAVPGADSTSGPAASSVDPHGFGPLLLAYKGPGGEHIRYQLFSGGSWTAFAFVTGANSTTAIAPALVNGTLASVSPTSSARIYLHYFS